MSCTKNELNCLNTVLDCGKNQVSIGNACYSVNKVKYPNTNIVRFDSLNKTDTSAQSYLLKTGVHNLVNFENTPILKCFQKCSQDENCDAIQFNFGNSTESNIDELNENGYCQLFNFKNSQSNLTTTKSQDTVDSPNSKYSNFSIYTKDKNIGLIDADPNGNFTVTNEMQIDDPTSLQFVKTNDNPGKITKLFSKYQGGICRNDLNETSCNLMSPYVSRWCQQNPNSETCKKFCEYSECPTKTIKSLVIYGALVLISLVLIVLAFGKTNNIWLKLLSIGIFIAMGVLLTIQIIRFTQPIYNGSEPNIVPDWYSISACDSGKYKNVLGNCI
tara:strand:- start:2341 stop:3330 length:990 start_codon:yes stop_codon:yes gene_type:complete